MRRMLISKRPLAIGLVFILGTSCNPAEPRQLYSPTDVYVEQLPHPTPPSTLPELIDVLSGDNTQARIGAAASLANMGAEAEPAVPALIDNLSYENSEVRRTAAMALGAIGPAAKAAVPALSQELLTDTTVHPRRAAAKALGEIGETSAVPSLADALYDDDVAIEVANSIGTLTGQEFPDLGGPTYSLNNNGTSLLVKAARDWWEQDGQYQSWGQPLSNS